MMQVLHLDGWRIVSRRPAVLVHIHKLFLQRIEDVINTQPKALRIAKEKHRKHRTEATPEDDLTGERKPCDVLKPEESRQHDCDGDRIVNINRSQEIALLALKPQFARQTFGAHGEQ